jgi:hypothetical protein
MSNATATPAEPGDLPGVLGGNAEVADFLVRARWLRRAIDRLCSSVSPQPVRLVTPVNPVWPYSFHVLVCAVKL